MASYIYIAYGYKCFSSDTIGSTNLLHVYAFTLLWKTVPLLGEPGVLQQLPRPLP